MLAYRGSAFTKLDASRAEPERLPAEHPRLDGIQRQKGGAARILAAQQGNARLGGGFVFHHDVLQRPAQSRFNGGLLAGLHAQDGGHRPDDAPQAAGRRRPHHGLDGVLVAVHVLFQLFQNGKPLAGGVQLPAQLLLGHVGFVQGIFAVFELQLQPRPDVCQLLFVLRQQGLVLPGVVQVGLGVVPLSFQCLDVLLQRWQAALGRFGGSLGGGFGHLCLGALGRQGGQLLPQNVPLGPAGIALLRQAQQLLVEGGQLLGQLPPGGLHAFCHRAVAFQRSGGLGPVLLPGGFFLPEGGGVLLVAGDVVFQHRDAALAAG